MEHVRKQAPNLAKCCETAAHVGQIWLLLAELGPKMDKVGQCLLSFGVKVGQIQPSLAKVCQIWPTSGDVGPKLGSLCKTSTSLGQLSSNFQTTSELAGFDKGNFPVNVVSNPQLSGNFTLRTISGLYKAPGIASLHRQLWLDFDEVWASSTNSGLRMFSEFGQCAWATSSTSGSNPVNGRRTRPIPARTRQALGELGQFWANVLGKSWKALGRSLNARKAMECAWNL